MAAIESEIQELPYQYESYLGERGSTCQVGKSRGITIARALAINPNIIILDDCLSAVDSRVEQTIIRNILKNFQIELCSL